MTSYPTEQGYYEMIDGAWWRAVSVPCSHLMHPNSRYAVLYHRFCYVDSLGQPHEAGEGFPFDGLTIPRLLWRVAGHPWGRYLPDGVIHDSDCALAMALPPGERRAEIRLHADRRFREGLSYLGAHEIVQCAWYRSVRLGSLATAWRPAGPDYRTDLESYYRQLGITSDVLDAVLAGQFRHNETHNQGKAPCF